MRLTLKQLNMISLVVWQVRDCVTFGILETFPDSGRANLPQGTLCPYSAGSNLPLSYPDFIHEGLEVEEKGRRRVEEEPTR